MNTTHQLLGNSVRSASEAACRTSEAATAAFRELWSTANRFTIESDLNKLSDCGIISKRVLADMYPRFAGALLRNLPDRQEVLSKDTVLDFDVATAALLEGILNGVLEFESSELHKKGAGQLLSLCPRSVAKPATPFDDIDPYLDIK